MGARDGLLGHSVMFIMSVGKRRLANGTFAHVLPLVHRNTKAVSKQTDNFRMGPCFVCLKTKAAPPVVVVVVVVVAKRTGEWQAEHFVNQNVFL